MATAPEQSIEELNRQSARLEAETRKLMAEAAKLNAEEYKLSSERAKLDKDRSLSPWVLLAQGLLGGAALLGAALALLKYLAG
jgi:hypothetical protein